ncbi:major facilitator superfamily domain-containing protein [Thelonectria olida]|uniref:Major facilitator superfamily domain-containing protein n=1 Tax=Thelonectria olida TaxID=1576542 RepID=A0A9P8VSV0_9HYPO|nr:major facilitator superfamily domain-containing protein [Thelonectria olida]
MALLECPPRGPQTSLDEPREKGSGAPAPTIAELFSTSFDTDPTCDPAIEARARRKVDRSVLVLLVLGLFVFQLDRMNLASALTGGFADDIHVDQATINLGNQLMFATVVVFEIPCNMALQRFGTRKWISGQVFMFGLVATTQVFIRNRAGFLAARVALGFAEAGYTPGAMYTLSLWYKPSELAKRISVFFFGMFGGNAISPILASLILRLDGRHGIHGWQWIFLLEGLLTIVVSILIFLFLLESPDFPRSLTGLSFVSFSGDEQQVLQTRLEGRNVGHSRGKMVDLKTVWKTVSHYRRWPHYVSTLVVFSTFSPLSTYSPSIIVSLGFDRLTANALAAVGASLALPVVFSFGYLSDRTNRRGATVISAQLCYLVILIVARQTHPHVEGKWSRWGLWTAVNAFAVGYHPVHNSWTQLNCHEPAERSIALAMWVMSATTGLMIGAQYFQADDKPFYQNGLRTMVIMVSVGVVFATIQLIIYKVHNNRVDAGKRQLGDERLLITYTP